MPPATSSTTADVIIASLYLGLPVSEALADDKYRTFQFHQGGGDLAQRGRPSFGGRGMGVGWGGGKSECEEMFHLNARIYWKERMDF